MNKQQLANKIWESANKMRSKIEANEYKDYILGFIFYKFLSDKEVDFLKKDGYEEADLQEHVHENNEELVDYTSDQQIDLLIVVDQMLTGFDSKWINTLYLDKILVYEKLIQAFSRTNRLYGPEKPFGTIRYYRKPYTMQRNVEEAFKLYSGDRPLGLFADKLEHNLEKMNALYDDIGSIFRSAGIENRD